MRLQVIRRDEVSGAATLLYKVLVDRGVSWSHACAMLTDTIAAAKAASERKQASGCFFPAPLPGC